MLISLSREIRNVRGDDCDDEEKQRTFRTGEAGSGPFRHQLPTHLAYSKSSRIFGGIPMIGRFKIQASAPTNVSPRSNFIPPHNLTPRSPGKCFNVVTRGGMKSVSVVGALTDVGKSGFWERWNVI
jgi:hypothetical protein